VLSVTLGRELSDGLVSIRPMTGDDVPSLVAGRDEVARRFLGDGDPEPRPIACIVVDGQVVGWVDYDHDRDWLADDELNLGYMLFPEHRGEGYASRAVRLLLRHLAEDTPWQVATLLIHPENAASLALARRLGFRQVGALDGNPYWKLPIEPA
jgi:RimJ/RimL family protein N-acetyltransferase